MFFDDAITASKALEITLTGKECGLEERAPMCGVPFHAADNYIDRLVKKGYRVAIAEQMEDPKLAKGLVKREVIRVVTPGTICDNKALDETKNNYLMSIAYVGGIYGVLRFLCISVPHQLQHGSRDCSPVPAKYLQLWQISLQHQIQKSALH